MVICTFAVMLQGVLIPQTHKKRREIWRS